LHRLSKNITCRNICVGTVNMVQPVFALNNAVPLLRHQILMTKHSWTLPGFSNVCFRWQMVGLGSRHGGSVVCSRSVECGFVLPHCDLQENPKAEQGLPIFLYLFWTRPFVYCRAEHGTFWREYVFKFASVVGGNPEKWW
jgi:hypothetical protein